MWLKIKRKTKLSVPELAMFLSPAGNEGPSIEGSLLSPTLCWRQVQPWGQFVQSQMCKKRVAAAAPAPATPQSCLCLPGLSCLPVVTAAGKCFSSDGFQSCHSVIPCVRRQKTPPDPSLQPSGFSAHPPSCSHSLTTFQGNHGAAIALQEYFFSFPQVPNHPYYPFLIN